MARPAIKSMCFQESGVSFLCVRRQFATFFSKRRKAQKISNETNKKDCEPKPIPTQNKTNAKQFLKRTVLPAVALGGVSVLVAKYVLYGVGFGAEGIDGGSIVSILQSTGAGGIGAVGYVGIFSTVFVSYVCVMLFRRRVLRKKTQKWTKKAK